MKAKYSQQVAAVAIFVATKVEEHARKLKELVIACCRVAQKNPNLLVDEQTKDYWRWRDTILLNEDVLLELLCFDLTLKSPYKILYDIIKAYNVAHNRPLRDTAWAFLNDSGMTQLCLLFPARTIAAAALYCAARRTGVSFPDDGQGRPWWETQKVKGHDLRGAYNHMAALYKDTPLKPGSESIYVGGLTPLHADERFAKTRLRTDKAPGTPDQAEIEESRRNENGGATAHENAHKRAHDAKEGEGGAELNGNGNLQPVASRVPAGARVMGRWSKRQKTEEPETPPKEQPANNGIAPVRESSEGSEEGEL
jgi:protein BUR2